MLIVADYILEHCIEVDEDLLADDINRRYTIDEMYSEKELLMAIDRQKKPANYYKVRNMPKK